jgi:hypothetical protein
MRASSLSNPRVIELLNQYFVPVYVSNEDYREGGCAPAEERAECRRIYLEALNAKMSAGTVHAYVTAPDGHTIDSRHVAAAYKVEELTTMLERTIERLKTPAGEPLVEPSPQSRQPEAEPDSLVLHLTARNLVRLGDELVPARTVLGETRSANWGSYPAENWIVLAPVEWHKLLPPGNPAAARGDKWDLDHEVSAKFLTHFYPSTENNDVAKNRIEQQTLRARVLSVEDGTVRARLDGSLRMKHPFYHKHDGNFVDATLVGVLEFEPATEKIRSLQLVTSRAMYGTHPTVFGVALRSLP